MYAFEGYNHEAFTLLRYVLHVLTVEIIYLLEYENIG